MNNENKKRFLVWLTKSLKDEIKFLAQQYRVSMQQILIQIIIVGIAELQKENLLIKTEETKKFLCKNLREGSDDDGTK